jgi:dTDP-4-dehydrorhamnose reductase
MAKILVIGAGGQLGHCLQKCASEAQMSDISFPSEKEANILDRQQLDLLFATEQAQWVINCAAYTAVDKAEDEPEIATQVNVEGALNLAELCQKHQAKLVHISTDFVFKGQQVKLLREEDETKPISVYGETKLQSEVKVAAALKKHIIIRTSWLYSEFGNNFVKTMCKLGTERDELNIIADQIGSPTYAIDLAKAILAIIAADYADYGIYHYSNEGAISWFDFACAIFRLTQTEVKVNPIPTSAYPTKAKRPHFSVMDKTKIKTTFNLNIPHWHDSLSRCVEQLNNS